MFLKNCDCMFISGYEVNKFIVVYIGMFWIVDVMIGVIILWGMGLVWFMRLFVVVI